MSLEQNKALVRRAYEGFNDGNVNILDEVFAPDYVAHFPGTEPVEGRDAAKQLVGAFMEAFPDLQFTIEDQIAEGDKVVTRWTAAGMHTATGPDNTTSDRQVTFSGIDVHRVVGGKIAEHAGISDNLGVLQQLGGVPALSEGGG